MPRDGDDETSDVLPELASGSWHSKDEAASGASFGAMTRSLPGLVGQAVRWAFAAGRRDATAMLGFTVASGVFTAVGLFATTSVLTPLFAGGPTPDRLRAALPALVVVGAAAAMRSLLSAAAGWAQGRLEPVVNELIARRLFEQTTRVELSAYDDPEFYELLQRARDRGLLEGPAIVRGVADLATGLAGLVAAGSVLGVLHPALLGLLAVAVVPDGWAVFRTAHLRYATWRMINRMLRRRHVLSDMMADRDSAAEVRAFGMRDHLLREYDATSAREVAAHRQLARRQALTRIAGDAASGVATAGVYVVLAGMLVAGLMPLAVAGTAVLAIQTGGRNLFQVMYAVNSTYESGLYFADVIEFLDQTQTRLPPDVDETGRSVRSGQILVEGVGFSYPGECRPALDDVSISIQPGETVALVGENGSGKTTLAKLIAGLYRPDHGRVTWNGVDLATADPHQVWSQIALISQDYARWPTTARQNVTMARRFDPDAFAAATRVSGAADVVADLDQGWNALLDKRFHGGHDLSGGQWQRIAVARGLYQPGSLLICDEPTAALDARAEHTMFEAIRTRVAGRTTVLITHRLASVRFADRIYVLDRGRVIEHGTHHDLLRANGRYAELYLMQAAAYRTDTSGGSPG